MIDSITVTVHHDLAKITPFCVAMAYHRKPWMDCISGIQTQLPTKIRKMVAWLLAMDRFTCPTNICEVCSKFPSCLIVVWTINLGVQGSICSDRNCGCYSADILLWHTTNGNGRFFIDWQNQPDIHCPHHDSHPPLSVRLENRRL